MTRNEIRISSVLSAAYKYSHDHRRVREQHHQPRAAPLDVFGEIKHSWWKINQQRDKAQKEKPAQKVCGTGRSRHGSKRQQIPADLKENHVYEDADVAESLACRTAQEFKAR